MDTQAAPTHRTGRTELARTEREIELLRVRVAAEWPYSPAWDAAMSALEEAERRLWRLEETRRA